MLKWTFPPDGGKLDEMCSEFSCACVNRSVRVGLCIFFINKLWTINSAANGPKRSLIWFNVYSNTYFLHAYVHTHTHTRIIYMAMDKFTHAFNNWQFFWVQYKWNNSMEWIHIHTHATCLFCLYMSYICIHFDFFFFFFFMETNPKEMHDYGLIISSIIAISIFCLKKMPSMFKWLRGDNCLSHVCNQPVFLESVCHT